MGPRWPPTSPSPQWEHQETGSGLGKMKWLQVAHDSPPQSTAWPSDREEERTCFNFLLGPPHDKGEISPNIIIAQKILSGTIKREIQ